MNFNNTHIIQKVNVEINMQDEVKAYELKNNISKLLNDKILPEIEKLFENEFSNEHTIRMDSLNINLAVDANSFEDSVQLDIVKELRKQIKEQKASPPSHPNSESKPAKQFSDNIKKPASGFQQSAGLSDDENSFIHFLQTGRLAWHQTNEKFELFIQEANFIKHIQQSSFTDALTVCFKQFPYTVFRYINLFSDSVIFETISALAKTNRTDLYKEVCKTIVRQNVETTTFHQVILEKILKINHPVRLIQMVSELKKGFGIFTKPENNVIPVNKNSSKAADAENKLSQQLQNSAVDKIAGIIDSIKEVFTSFKIDTTDLQLLAKEVEQIKKQNQHIAEKKELLPTATQAEAEKTIIKTSSRKHPETESNDPTLSYTDELQPDSQADYVENAGLILAHPFIQHLFSHTGCINNKKQITSYTKAVLLLHYLATGNSKPKEFELILEKHLCGIPAAMPIDTTYTLSKEEKKECKEVLKAIVSYWPALKSTSSQGLQAMFMQRPGKLELSTKPKLTIERKAQDILLQKLDWNISMVKLPWMKTILFVEW